MCLNFLVSCDASKILRVFKVHLERNTSKPSKICGEFLLSNRFEALRALVLPKAFSVATIPNSPTAQVLQV